MLIYFLIIFIRSFSFVIFFKFFLIPFYANSYLTLLVCLLSDLPLTILLQFPLIIFNFFRCLWNIISPLPFYCFLDFSSLFHPLFLTSEFEIIYSVRSSLCLSCLPLLGIGFSKKKIWPLKLAHYLKEDPTDAVQHLKQQARPESWRIQRQRWGPAVWVKRSPSYTELQGLIGRLYSTCSMVFYIGLSKYSCLVGFCHH